MQKKSDEPKQKQLLSENLKVQNDSRIDSDLKEIMDAQIEKIESDDQWAEKWMVDYEGYQPIGEPNLSPPRPTPLKRHQCSYCPKSFAHAGHLRMHVTVHSQNRPFGKCPNLMSFYKNSMHFCIISFLACKCCPRSFKRKGDLQNHMRIYHSNEKHVCPICKEGFPTPFLRLRHTRKHVQNGECTMVSIFLPLTFSLVGKLRFIYELRFI